MARFAYDYRNVKPTDLTPSGPDANKLIVGGREVAAPPVALGTSARAAGLGQ